MGTSGVALRVRVDRADPAGAVAAGAVGLGELGELAVAAEAAGFDALYLAGGRRCGADPFVTLGAVAALTGRLTLGCVATPVDERPPSLLAKVVASLDVCSAGRALAVLGPAAGGDDLERLGEALEVCRAMLRLPEPTMAGRHYRIVRAFNEPKAEREVPTPVGLLVPDEKAGLTEERAARLLTLAARFADVCFLAPGIAPSAVLGPLADGLRTACRQAGRVPGSVVVAPLLAADGDTAPEDLAALGARYRDAGAGALVCDWRGGPAGPGVLARLAEALGAG